MLQEGDRIRAHFCKDGHAIELIGTVAGMATHAAVDIDKVLSQHIASNHELVRLRRKHRGTGNENRPYKRGDTISIPLMYCQFIERVSDEELMTHNNECIRAISSRIRKRREEERKQMDKDKVFNCLEVMDITIGRMTHATKLFAFRCGDGASPRFEMDEIIADNTDYQQGVTVEINYNFEKTPGDVENVSEQYDWDDNDHIEDFVKCLIEHFELNEQEVRFLFKFAELHLPEVVIMKLFNHPTEAFLTHQEEDVRKEGLLQVGDKTD